MADTKISELDAAATLDGSELVPIVQDSATVAATLDDIAALSGTSASPVVLAETTLGANAANIEFASISAAYRHLRIEGQLRTTEAVIAGYVKVQVGNGSIDTGSNYRAFAYNLAVNDYTSASRVDFVPGKVPASTADADVFGHFELLIHDYRSTTYWRLMTGRTVYMAATTSVGGYWDGQGQWKNKASAIDVVRISPNSGNFLAGSSLRLIGIPAP